MVISGVWRVCDDGVVRPVLPAEARTAAGAWAPIEFLVDIGADCTVFSAADLQALAVQPTPAKESIEGVGGKAESVSIATSFRLTRENGTTIQIDGPFAAVTDPSALDISVIGRDVTNHFGVLIDRPQDLVCLVCAKHRCVIVET